MEFKRADEEFAARFLEAVKSRDVDQMREVMWKQNPFVTVGMAGIQRHLLFHILPLKKAEPQDLLVADVVYRTMLRELKDKPVKFLDAMATIQSGANQHLFTELSNYINTKTTKLFPVRFDQHILKQTLGAKDEPGSEPK
jgi:hypothetical protein